MYVYSLSVRCVYSAVFKAPAAPAIAGGPPVDTKILKKKEFWTVWSCISQTRPKCTILSQKIKNLTRVAHQKIWVSPRGRKEDLAEGAQSH